MSIAFPVANHDTLLSVSRFAEPGKGEVLFWLLRKASPKRRCRNNSNIGIMGQAAAVCPAAESACANQIPESDFSEDLWRVKSSLKCSIIT